MDDDNKKHIMDPRCPRKLKCQPKKWCPLAVMRLKALRAAPKELTEQEESKLPGCPWAVNHQMANYCFFNYASQFMSEEGALSATEIAHLNSISVDSVKQIEKESLEKVRSAGIFKEIKDLYKDEQIVEDSSTPDTFPITRK